MGLEVAQERIITLVPEKLAATFTSVACSFFDKVQFLHNDAKRPYQSFVCLLCKKHAKKCFGAGVVAKFREHAPESMISSLAWPRSSSPFSSTPTHKTSTTPRRWQIREGRPYMEVLHPKALGRWVRKAFAYVRRKVVAAPRDTMAFFTSLAMPGHRRTIELDIVEVPRSHSGVNLGEVLLQILRASSLLRFYPSPGTTPRPTMS